MSTGLNTLYCNYDGDSDNDCDNDESYKVPMPPGIKSNLRTKLVYQVYAATGYR